MRHAARLQREKKPKKNSTTPITAILLTHLRSSETIALPVDVTVWVHSYALVCIRVGWRMLIDQQMSRFESSDFLQASQKPQQLAAHCTVNRESIRYDDSTARLDALSLLARINEETVAKKRSFERDNVTKRMWALWGRCGCENYFPVCVEIVCCNFQKIYNLPLPCDRCSNLRAPIIEYLNNHNLFHM